MRMIVLIKHHGLPLQTVPPPQALECEPCQARHVGQYVCDDVWGHRAALQGKGGQVREGGEDLDTRGVVAPANKSHAVSVP